MCSCGDTTPSWGGLGLNPLRLLYNFLTKLVPLPGKKVVIIAVTPEGYGDTKCHKFCVKFLANCLGAGKSNAGQSGCDCVVACQVERQIELPTTNIPAVPALSICGSQRPGSAPTMNSRPSRKGALCWAILGKVLVIFAAAPWPCLGFFVSFVLVASSASRWKTCLSLIACQQGSFSLAQETMQISAIKDLGFI